MRTPEQIYKKYKAFCSGITKEEFINTIYEIQKEAFNEGIDKAVEVANTCLNIEKTSIIVNKKEILNCKLK